ncbi:hypothetical protein [Beijerinckia mobilis]|uniref:hypothetical protein n=1 Tax=Beijerinckia mobilis TaxID=231434 RepID=UPI0012EBCFE4|nr:hypothetical protein [Beijerinckia mobilis]
MTMGKSFALAAMVSVGLTGAGLAGTLHEPYTHHHHPHNSYGAADLTAAHNSGIIMHHVYCAGEGSATNDNLNIGNSGPN